MRDGEAVLEGRDESITPGDPFGDLGYPADVAASRTRARAPVPGPSRRAPAAWRRRIAWGLLAVTALAAPPGRAADPGTAEDREQRLRAMRQEIERLRIELAGLEKQEKGLLGEVARLSALLRLRDEESLEARLRLDSVTAAVEERSRRLDELARAQAERRDYLASRLRETYEAGAGVEMRRLLSGHSAEEYLSALRYAAFLSERDARRLRAFRGDEARLRGERAALVEERGRLEGARSDAERTLQALERSRAERSRLLQGIRRDRGKHEEAIGDLERASRELGRLLERLGTSTAPALDVRRFRGLLDWPASGAVTAGFGDAVHPRFRTVVPHPGLDIDAADGSTFRSVFEGKVAFASWLHGYGLTAIVDHGGGVVSIYAHAATLLVEAGQDVSRAQALGRVGDTGSLRGPYLYFEMRESGRAVDPAGWLRKR